MLPGVWDTDTLGRLKLADPIKIELQTGVRPVAKKQYHLRLENRKGVQPIINKSLPSRLLKDNLIPPYCQ